MGAHSKIEWTDASWTPIRARSWPYGNRAKPAVGWHCEHVSEGCRFCYAARTNKRLGTGLEFKPGNRDKIELLLDETMLLAPLSWRKPRMIFVCSMTDIFADFVPGAWIDQMFAVMALCPQHTFQVLTKRPARMREWSKLNSTGGHIFHVAQQADPRKHGAASGAWPLPNVWLGASCEDQGTFDQRWKDLREVTAAVTFLSMEPLLGDIFFRPEKPDWIIAGGESGPHARPLHPDWARSLRDQCAAAGVPFFFKQWGEWVPEQDAVARRLGCYAARDGMCRVGTNRAGRLLDGAAHNGFPEPRG